MATSGGDKVLVDFVNKVNGLLRRPDPWCTVSVGVATNLTANDSVDSLVARADAAMYRAKAKGRNRVEGS